MALAWQAGADPYCIHNGLDAAYRPLSHRHPCPNCLILKRVQVECELCGGKEFIEIPLAEPGEAMPPPYPRRLRNLIFGFAQAMDERASKRRSPL